MKRKLTVTVGIPAYNEEANIGRLLESVLSQKRDNYKLEKIVVVQDGCMDNTGKIVKVYSKKYKFIKLAGDCKRIGKSKRLNYLYKSNKSDILVTFDGDITLTNNQVINELINKFKSPQVGLVGGFNLPNFPKNFFEKIVVTWINLWNEIRKDLGNSVHNHLGCISASRREFTKQVIIPEGIVADDDFIYFKALTLGFEFRFAKKAIVYYSNVSNLKDFFNQHSRLLNGKLAVADYFGEWVKGLYKVSSLKKLKALFKTFLKNPFLMILAILLQLALRNDTKKNKHRNLWKTALSSKKVRFV